MNTIYELSSPHTELVYIGRTTSKVSECVSRLKHSNHRMFDFDDVVVTVLEEDIADADVKQRQTFHIEQKMPNVVNKRKPYRTKEEVKEEQNAKARQKYTPIKDGGDGSYAQLARYNELKDEICRKKVIESAKARQKPPSPKMIAKYNITPEEL